MLQIPLPPGVGEIIAIIAIIVVFLMLAILLCLKFTCEKMSQYRIGRLFLGILGIFGGSFLIYFDFQLVQWSLGSDRWDWQIGFLAFPGVIVVILSIVTIISVFIGPRDIKPAEF